MCLCVCCVCGGVCGREIRLRTRQVKWRLYERDGTLAGLSIRSVGLEAAVYGLEVVLTCPGAGRSLPFQPKRWHQVRGAGWSFSIWFLVAGGHRDSGRTFTSRVRSPVPRRL